ARGFTLIELMVVVIIIAVLAVIAIPQITFRMRDRRTQAAAQEVSTLFRNARLRAMGRGSAVLVRYTTTDARGTLEVREAVGGTALPAACQTLPSGSCRDPNWDGVDSRLVRSFGASVAGTFASINIHMRNPDNTAISAMDVCFTPLGRTLVRFGSGGWGNLTNVPRANVWRDGGSGTAVGLTRVVLIPPNGMARLGTAPVPVPP
ncbi:MAG TPA: prepilin-type N-terminal cleavage/methylation domain-containing protein, partial [Polyangiaceae bacterium]